eukprot:TRINITY_DN2984_c0_g5_i1.p1 TRINITY_DN2984_c0_g5~~TRINITY_DN2984_c0_g5_i1.p1  ORF type:complete len:217 (+),score=27.09 TRINITY_DN2984_c0_g5_i1:84-653(+)
MNKEDYELLAYSILAELNLARHFPHLVTPSLTQRLEYFHHFKYSPPNYEPVDTVEGKTAVRECIDFLKVQPSTPLVSMHKRLTLAAQSLAKHFSKCIDLGTAYEDTCTAEERIAKYVNWKTMAGECVSIGNTIASDVVNTLLIDDGVENRYNRRLLFNKNATLVGIACVPNELFGVVTVIDVIGGELNY